MEARTDTQLKQLALDVVEGRVFVSWQLGSNNESLVNSVFMPLLFMTEEQVQEMKRHKVVQLYEYLEKAGQKAIDGFPMFMSMQMLTEAEIEPLQTHIARAMQLKAEFLNG